MSAAGTVPVLMYHQITGATRARLAVSPAAFAGQLTRLRAAGFTSLTAGALAATLAGGQEPLPERCVVLTFDDGYADFAAVALPLLAQHGFTATVFVTTGWMEQAGAVSPAARPPGAMLSWSQVAEAAEAGMEIGAHSCLHPQLDRLGDDRLSAELRVSKSALEDRLGRPVAGMAYPFGYSDGRVQQAARQAGYRYACAVGNALASAESDPFALPRLTIRRSTRARAFDAVVHGRRVARTYRGDRALTAGWSLVRRAQAIRHGVSTGG